MIDPTLDPDRADARRAVVAAFGPLDLWDAHDLAANLALPRSTVERLLGELERDGVIRRDPDGAFVLVGAETA